MVLAARFKNVVGKSVFGEVVDVSEDNMHAAALTLTDTTCNENTLVAQGLKRHDPELLDQLIVQYQHRLLRYLLYLTGNRETAEDVFQETWMRVLKRGDQFNGKSRFDTWLFTIARNLVIDVRRKRTMSSLEAMRETGEDGRAFDVPAEGPSPFEQYLTSENGQRVAEALLTLEPLHREVLVLRFHEEMSLEEIAQVTHAPLSTVKSRLYRGLSALRPRIAASEAGLRAEGATR
jgi:RNA polymerase sigma-70 factor (ECF subfamily)